MYVVTKDGMNIVNYGGSVVRKDDKTGKYKVIVIERIKGWNVVYGEYDSMEGARASAREMLTSMKDGMTIYDGSTRL